MMRVFKKFLTEKITAASVIAFIITLVFCLGVYGLSWIISCGVIKLITLCFGWTFSWSEATGVWLITCGISSIFGRKGK